MLQRFIGNAANSFLVVGIIIACGLIFACVGVGSLAAQQIQWGEWSEHRAYSASYVFVVTTEHEIIWNPNISREEGLNILRELTTTDSGRIMVDSQVYLSAVLMAYVGDVERRVDELEQQLIYLEGHILRRSNR